MIPTFGVIKNWDFLLEKHQGQQKQEKQCVLDKEQNKIKNPLFEDNKEVQVLCRSLKKKKQFLDISFQADFMNDHENSLKYKLRNYIETSINQAQQYRVQQSFHQLFPLLFVTQSLNQLTPLNITENSLLTKQQKIQFSKDLQPEDKMTQFLQILSKYVTKNVSDELIYVSFLMWELYIQTRKPMLLNYQIQAIVTNYVQKNSQQLFRDQNLCFLTFKKVSQESKNPIKVIEQAFKQFIKYFGQTIILIIEGYFENPYLIQRGKREKDEQYLNIDYNDQEQQNFPQTQSSESWTSRQFPSKARKLF